MTMSVVMSSPAAASAPIPVEAFLTSWGMAAGDLPVSEPDDTFLTSPVAAAVLRACASWRQRSAGRRPDLAPLANKTLGTRVAAELRQEVSEQLGAVAGGRGLETLGFDIVTTRRGRPQAGLRMTHTDEKVLGVGRHLIVVVFDLDGDEFHIDTVKLIPAWETADRRASATAEQLRLQIAAGSRDVTSAAADLAAAGVATSPRLIAALTSRTPIPAGTLRLSAAAEWRARFDRDIADGHDVNTDDLEDDERPVPPVAGQGVLDLGV